MDRNSNRPVFIPLFILLTVEVCRNMVLSGDIRT